MTTSTTRRTPQQRRSRAKVDAILDASEKIIVSNGVDGLSTTIVAAQAGMAVGTLYQYFHSIDAILDALTARHADTFAIELKEALSSRTFRRKRDAANAALDSLIDYYRTHESFRALWRAAPNTIGAGFVDAGDVLVGIVIDALETQGLASRGDEAFVREVEVQWSVAQALIRLAFQRDRDGDPVVLNHLRRLWDLDVLPLYESR